MEEFQYYTTNGKEVLRSLKQLKDLATKKQQKFIKINIMGIKKLLLAMEKSIEIIPKILEQNFNLKNYKAPTLTEQIPEVPPSMHSLVDNRIDQMIQSYGVSWYEGNFRNRIHLRKEFDYEQEQKPFNRRKTFEFLKEYKKFQ